MFNRNRYTSATIPTKSLSMALLLTLILGPFGMLYSTIKGAIIMLILSTIICISTNGVGLIIVWPVQLTWTAIAVNLYNKKVLDEIIYYRRASLKMRAYSQ